jgi:hypothetical protein
MEHPMSRLVALAALADAATFGVPSPSGATSVASSGKDF